MQVPVSKTLLVAWDAADWLLLEPMLEAGKLPNLQSLVESGLLGGFAVAAPLDPAVLANSLSTGFAPEIHGILAHPASATERRVPDLAERFAAAGRLAISVGWPASHGTAPRANLLRVSDRFDEAPPASAGEVWRLPAGAVLPETQAADIAELRLHPGEFCPSDLAPLVSGIEAMDLAAEPRVSLIAQGLAASLSRQSAATYLTLITATPSNGTISFAVNPGDTFGFQLGGSYQLSTSATITNFAAAVPEPSASILLATDFTGLIGMRRRQQAAA